MIRIFCALVLLWPGLVLGQGNVLNPTSPVYVNGNLLRSALLTARNNSTIRVLEGVYTNRSVMHAFDGNVPWRMQRLTNVNLIAHGANFFWPTQISALEIRDCENVTVDGLALFNDKSNPNPPAWMTNWFATKGVWGAITIHDSQGIVIKNCILDGMWNHGILAAVHGAWTTNDATNAVSILNNKISRTGWAWGAWTDGAGIVTHSGWLVSGNHLDKCGMGVELYPRPGSSAIRSVTVSGNHIHNAAGTAIGMAQAYNCSVTGNSVDNDYGFTEIGGNSYGMSLDQVVNCIITGNTIRNRVFAVGVLGPVTNTVFAANNIEFSNSGWYNAGNSVIRCKFVGNVFQNAPNTAGAGYGAFYGNGTYLGNEFLQNTFYNCATNPGTWAMNFNAGTLNTNRFEGNTFWLHRFTNAVAVSVSSATGVGNTWFNNRLYGSYTNDWAMTDISKFAPIAMTLWGNLSISITNNTPTHVAGNGSLCMVTDGRLFLRTNGTWLLK